MNIVQNDIAILKNPSNDNNHPSVVNKVNNETKLCENEAIEIEPNTTTKQGQTGTIPKNSCSLCQIRGKTYADLKRHVERDHNNSTTEEHENEILYQCSECSLTFLTSQEMSKHEGDHW